jgi:hypothetical protein
VSTPPEPPASIRVAATMCLVIAWLAVLRVASVLLLEDRVELPIYLLGFWIAPGLRQGARVWRRWALVVAGLHVLGAVVGMVLLFMGQPDTVTLFGLPWLGATRWTIVLEAVLTGLAGVWLWRNLTNPTAHEWFALDTA